MCVRHQTIDGMRPMIQNPFSKDFPIGRLSGQCAACDNPLQPGQVYYAAIWSQDEEYVRKDYHEQCWSQAPGDALGVWRSKGAPPANDEQAATRPGELLLNVFERLGEADGAGTHKLRFVLALLLLRRRLLRLSGTTEQAGVQVWRMRRTGQESPTDVICPPMSAEDTEQLSQQLADLLAGLDEADDVEQQE